MRWPWTRKQDPKTIRAECPHCRGDLPLTFEQAMLLADGQPAWVFCRVCQRIVGAVRREAPLQATAPLASAA